MTPRARTYLGLAAICGLSSVVYVLLPPADFLKNLSAVPIVGSLVAALWQLLRDQAAHERQLLLQDSQNRFSLGATSHMAAVAFDKHVQFCEEYVAEVHKTLHTLFREGPTQQVFPHTAALYSIQQKYSVWLTQQIKTNLEQFEGALRKIGANDMYLRTAGGAEDRQQRIAEMYKTFADVMGKERMGAAEWKGEKLSEELAMSMVIRRLRAILGTEELTQMRSAFVSKALAGLPRDG
jgi:hypothetical protein